MAIFDRGNIVSVPMDPAIGHEQRATRPALILTTKAFNKLGDVLLRESADQAGELVQLCSLATCVAHFAPCTKLN